VGTDRRWYSSVKALKVKNKTKTNKKRKGRTWGWITKCTGAGGMDVMGAGTGGDGAEISSPMQTCKCNVMLLGGGGGLVMARMGRR